MVDVLGGAEECGEGEFGDEGVDPSCCAWSLL